MSAAVSLPEDKKVHLAVLTNSAIACFRRCPREYQYRYVTLRRPRRASEALRFGTFFHLGLNAWWGADGEQVGGGRPEAVDRFEAALLAIRARAASNAEDADPYELVKAEELLLGYTARWADEDYETLAVERHFSMPLVNPATGAASRTFCVEGKIDVVARHRPSNVKRTVEHKTTSKDISLGADYWRLISAMDPQVSTYQPGARSAGFDVEDTLYDVIRKVGLRPYKATPDEDRKYKQEKSRACAFCKKKGNVAGPHSQGVPEDGGPELFCNGEGRVITEVGGQLYANQHDHDETPEEFRERVNADIAANPAKYYARGPVVRLEHDEKSHAGDVWQTAWMMRESANSNRFPRSPNACERFGRLCDYFAVCSGEASIDDDIRFRTSSTPHEEIAEV